MKNKLNAPVEVSGYRNVRLPTFDPKTNSVVDKWWSYHKNDNHGDDDFLPYDEDAECEKPSFLDG